MGIICMCMLYIIIICMYHMFDFFWTSTFQCTRSFITWVEIHLCNSILKEILKLSDVFLYLVVCFSTPLLGLNFDGGDVFFMGVIGFLLSLIFGFKINGFLMNIIRIYIITTVYKYRINVIHQIYSPFYLSYKN